VEGLLNNTQKLEQDDKTIIDRLPPDYSILEQVESPGFMYSNKDAYLGYATRGVSGIVGSAQSVGWNRGTSLISASETLLTEFSTNHVGRRGKRHLY